MIPGHTLYCCAMRRRKKAARVRMKGLLCLQSLCRHGVECLFLLMFTCECSLLLKKKVLLLTFDFPVSFTCACYLCMIRLPRVACASVGSVMQSGFKRLDGFCRAIVSQRQPSKVAFFSDGHVHCARSS